MGRLKKPTGFSFQLKTPEGWDLIRLGDGVSLQNGSAYNADHWQTSGYPIIRIQNLKTRSAPFNYYQGDPYGKVPVREGDLLFSWSGSKGTSFGPHIWRGPLGVLNQHIFKVHIEGKYNIDRDFLFYALKYLTKLIEEQAYGIAALVHVRKGDLEATPIPLPPLPEQRAIANVLRTIQQAKEATENVIAAAVQLKQSLMRHLFTYGCVPFEQAGNVQLRAAEDGFCPTSWESRKLSEIATLQTGGTPSREEPDYWTGNIPWIKTGEVNYDVIRSAEEAISQSGLENSNAKLFPVGTILLAMYGQGVTRGRVAQLGIEAATNQACAAITPTRDVRNDFLYALLTNVYERLRSMGHGANQRNLSVTLLKSLTVDFPGLGEQAEIARILSVADQKIRFERARRDALDKIFLSSLANLIDGRVRMRLADQ